MRSARRAGAVVAVVGAVVAAPGAVGDFAPGGCSAAQPAIMTKLINNDDAHAMRRANRFIPLS